MKPNATILKNWNSPRHAGQEPPKGELPITGVYSMGSTSSVGQSCSSDLDIWVCHQSWLDSEERQLLQRKCSLLESWAASLGVEVSFFLIDENRFRHNESGSLGGEDCGSTSISCCWMSSTVPRCASPGSVFCGIWCRAMKKSITTIT
jgi:adenylate cyclase class 1